jgi:DNA polymerase-3 subunit gamma/tau
VAVTAHSVAPHQALYRRWRAQVFAEIVGQTAVVTTLQNAVRLDRLSHGLLFVGPRGTGKTSLARIVAKAINCPDARDGEPCDRCPSCTSIREGRALDVVELDAASNNKVDDMRELLPRVYTAAADLRRKVFIVDEVQRIKEGWDVLLKTLEEPPDDVCFIFCTTNPSQIRPAVVSRLQRFTFRPLTVDEISGKLTRILLADGRRADEAAVTLVAQLAAGGMRDAESMLDQLLNTADDPLTVDVVQGLLGLADQDGVDAFLRSLADGDPLAGIRVLDDLESGGRDLVAFADQLVGRVRELLARALAADDAERLALGPTELARIARRLTALDANRTNAGGYRFQLELALLMSAADSEAPRRETPRADTSRAEGRSPDGARGPAPRTSREEDAPVRQAPMPAEARTTTAPSDRAPQAYPARSPDVTAAPSPPVRAPDPPVPARQRPAPAVATPPSESAGDSGIERLRREWPQVVAHVARNPATRPLIEACRPLDLRDGIVTLGFPEDQAFLREKAEQRRAALEDGVSAVLGIRVGVRCVVTNLEAGGPIALEPAVDLREHARRIFQDDLADVAEIS